MSRTQFMSPDRVRRTLTRLAFEIIERNRGADTLELVGIRQRGSAVAEAVARQIEEIEGREFKVHALDVAPFRDDREQPAPPDGTSSVDTTFTDRDVILIDDVLFTGRTVRAALDAVVRYGRPRTIQLVVLIDRGHREYPIQPDYVGRFVQTKHKERVVVDAESDFGIYIEE